MVKFNIKLKIGYSSFDIIEGILSTLPVERDEIREYRIIKRKLCLSDKSDAYYETTLAVSFCAEREAGLLKMKKKVSEFLGYELIIPQKKLETRPVVVGAGPAGLFAALVLAEAGANPIILERGLAIGERGAVVDRFFKLGLLDTECNIQYGEGGAGTYSDGKLKVGAMDSYKYKVLSEFVEAGADDDILYADGAHLGTDRLSDIVKNIRNKIITLGGEFYFSSRVTSLKIKNGKIFGLEFSRVGSKEALDCENVIFATGHSARDSFELLLSAGALLEPRSFGIGVRLEHPREYINHIVYGDNYKEELGTASYHLVTHLEGGRSVYSFCMCPGGSVVAAASEEGGIVTNGMSEYRRDGENSNAAILVSVSPSDFPDNDALSGIDLQRKIERRAFTLAGGNYKAPAERLDGFMNRRESGDFNSVKPTYPRKTEKIPSDAYLPDFVTDSIRAAMPDFDSWLSGYYYPEAVMTGPETRSTSAVRVLRSENMEAVGISGLYPAGEGSGYTGGIVSSARDGIAAAVRLLCDKGK